ncbi:HD domain-containing protein [Micromonospora haikouensis]|uniref:HD domain-containing protein n=1 Tax=Micromonospora TaxID=1873 RepID=UPI001E298861|nr:HD domain-containing protein [Micromonospora sp. NBRC 110038]
MSEDQHAAAMRFIFEAGVLKRAALIGMILAAMEGADPARVTMLCVLHDTQETRTTDLPHIAKRYLTAAVTEYEAGETLDAIVARDADKLECLVQAVEYRHQGIDNVQRWIDSSRAALRTNSAHRLADAALTGRPLAWLTPPARPE